MRTNRITVFDLFQGQHRYLAPLFQRGYVWTRADHWEPLWQDVLDQVAALERMEAGAHGLAPRHFLGAIVLNRLQTRITETPASEVIDGQQRLATLQVLLAALRDAAASQVGPFLAGTLDHLTGNQGPFQQQEERFKVWPTLAHRDDLRSVMEAGSPDELLRRYPRQRVGRRWLPPLPPLVEAYLFFFDAIVQHLRPAPGDSAADPSALPADPRRAERLIEAATRYFQLVAIELDLEDDPQIIFESLNARSVPLDASDLVRNYIFLRAARHGEDAAPLYDRWWRPFDEARQGGPSFWKEREPPVRGRRSRLDLLLLHHVASRTGRAPSMGRLFQEFRDWWEESAGPSTAEGLQALHRSAALFRDLLAPEGGSAFALFARRVRLLEASAVYPLLLWIGEQREALPESEFAGMLADLESYLVRRAVCGLPARGQDRVFLGILARLKETESPMGAALRRGLVELKGEAAEWPGDEVFRHHLIHSPLHRTLGPAKVAALLQALESQTPNEAGAPSLLAGAATVEPVLRPSDLQKGRARRAAGADDAATPVEPGEHPLPTLGNLALLARPLPPEVVGGSLSARRAALAGPGSGVNALLGAGGKWDGAAILRRGEWLAERALRLWRRPQ